MKDKIKATLEEMEKDGIIRKVTEHTDWVANVTFATKKDELLRVCLDPKRLNEALKRTPHKIPTVEELNPIVSGAKYFSKLDAKAGYWSVKLDEKSQLLTTFRSPLGPRYCFCRMPFGLSTSQDDYQRKMDEENGLKKCPKLLLLPMICVLLVIPNKNMMKIGSNLCIKLWTLA